MMRFSLLFLAALSLGACASDEAAAPSESVQDSAPTLDRQLDGAPVTSIVAEDGSIELGLTDAVLYGRLTDKAADDVRDELAKAEDEGGIGGFVAGAVSNAVSGAITTPIQFPLDDVETVKYEDDRLQIIFKDQSSGLDIDVDGKDFERQFSPDDARDFADAFHDLTGR